MLQRIILELPEFFNYNNCILLLKAMGTTLALSAFGCLIGFIIGFILSVTRQTRGWWFFPLRLIAIFFVEIFRRVPFLVTLLLIFFLFQGLSLPSTMFSVALVSVVLIASAYIGEIVRAGFDSVHKNQWDAASVMNFSLTQTLMLIVVPQAWKVILPPAFSFFLVFIKDTALASQIGVVELTYAARIFNNKGFSAALSFGTVLVLYFILSYPLARIGARMEVRLVSRHKKPESRI